MGGDGGSATVTTCWTDKLGDLQDYATAVKIDPSGDVIVVGRFSGDVDLGGTKLTAPPPDGGVNYGSFVARLRKTDGTAVWARTVGDTGQADLRGALAVDAAGRVTIGGLFHGTLADVAGVSALDPMGGGFIARLEGDTGTTLAARALDVSGGVNFVEQASDGSYVAAGYYGDYARLGSTPLPTTNSTDIWVARISLDDATTVRWATRIGGSGSDTLSALALSATDDALVTGSLDSAAHVTKLTAANGSVAWEHTYGGDKPVVTLLGILLGDELAVLGTMSAPTSVGGAVLPVDKSAETVWFGRWAVADGPWPMDRRAAHRASRARPPAPRDRSPREPCRAARSGI